MPATITLNSRRRFLRHYALTGFIVFSGSYTAAGDTITVAASLGMNKCQRFDVDGWFQGATHGYLFNVVPTSPDSAGNFSSCTLAVADMTLSTGATADLTAGAYPAALTGITPGIYFEAVCS